MPRTVDVVEKKPGNGPGMEASPRLASDQGRSEIIAYGRRICHYAQFQGIYHLGLMIM